MTVVGGGAVPVRGMHDYGALIGRFGIDFRGALLGIVVALISSSGTEAREARQPLSVAERLNVLVQDLIGRRSACRLLGDLVRHFQNRSAVLLRQIGSNARSLTAAMAGVTGQHAAPAGIAFVDSV